MAEALATQTEAMTKVLVVDDDEVIRTTFSDIFKKKGYLVTTVATGKEALDQVKKTSFNFAIIDIRLPDISGFDLLDQIRKIDFRINCIMMTGHSDEDPNVSIEKGATAHFVKPLKVEQLLAIFQKKTA